MESVMLVFTCYFVNTITEGLIHVQHSQHSCIYKMHSNDKYRVHLDGNKQQR